MRSIDKPVLLVHGERDRLVPIAAARAVAADNPAWETTFLPGVGPHPAARGPRPGPGAGDRPGWGTTTSPDPRAPGSSGDGFERPAMTTAYLTCPLCEATCGLAVTLDGDAVTSVRGDDDDAFSHGFICPKGASLKALHEDPDRLRHADGQARRRSGTRSPGTRPSRRSTGGSVPLVAEHGPEAVAFYLGNPSSHNLGVTLYGRAFYKAVGTHNIYTAGSVDQLPKHYSSGYLFGDPLSIPVPDLDRTQHLLLLGANPLVSNGSLMTVPDARGRLKAIRDRGGKVVVVDPRRTRTAEAGRRAPRHQARHRRPAALRAAQRHPATRGWPTSATWPTT